MFFAMVAYEFQCHPQLRRFTPSACRSLSRIHEALGRVEIAPILPSSRDVLRFTATAGTIHFSTLLEGNQLPIAYAEAAARGDAEASADRAKRELINYADALRFIDEWVDRNGQTCPDSALLLELHRRTTTGLGSNDAGPMGQSFTEDDVGVFRPGSVIILDEFTNKVVFEGPTAERVEPLIDGVFEWLAAHWNDEVEWPAPALAAILHFKLTEIHPFADGNGRVARLMAYLVMSALGYMPNRMFNLDAHYGKDKASYLQALRSVTVNTNSMNTWVEYFLEGAAAEYERVGSTITALVALASTPAGTRQLTIGQERALTTLLESERNVFTVEEYERIAQVSKGTARKELSALQNSSIISPVSNHRGTYTLTSKRPEQTPPRRRSSPTVWNDESIRAALTSLIGTGDRFPSQKTFAEHQQMGLYQAISRGAGTQAWAERLGVAAPKRGRPRKNDT